MNCADAEDFRGSDGEESTSVRLNRRRGRNGGRRHERNAFVSCGCPCLLLVSRQRRSEKPGRRSPRRFRSIAQPWKQIAMYLCKLPSRPSRTVSAKYWRYTRYASGRRPVWQIIMLYTYRETRQDDRLYIRKPAQRFSVRGSQYMCGIGWLVGRAS